MGRREFNGVPATTKTPLDINLISQTKLPACYSFFVNFEASRQYILLNMSLNKVPSWINNILRSSFLC